MQCRFVRRVTDTGAVCRMAGCEAVSVWVCIRDSSSALHRAGSNPGQLLAWSRGRSKEEVRAAVQEILGCQAPPRLTHGQQRNNLASLTTSISSSCRRSGGREVGADCWGDPTESGWQR